MTTEQQAREALVAIKYQLGHLANGPDLIAALDTFITQAAEDKRIADAVRGAAGGECVEVGDDDEGQPRILIHSTRDELKCGGSLCFKRVLIIPASVLEGGS